MSEQPSFPIPETAPADPTTGRYIITFREDAVTEGLALLSDQAGITGLANAADFPESALDFSQLEAGGGAVFPTLGVARRLLRRRGFQQHHDISGRGFCHLGDRTGAHFLRH